MTSFTSRDVIGGQQLQAAAAGHVTTPASTTRGRGRWGVTLRRVLSHVALGAFALVAVGIFAVAVLPSFGARVLVVASGSMEPYASAGDALVVADVPTRDIAPDDVVTFLPIGGDELVTHRVVSLHELPGGRHFRTQGDANRTPDVDLAPAEAVVGRSEAVLPGLGRFLLLLRSRAGQTLVLVVPSALLLLGELRSLVADRRPARSRWSPTTLRRACAASLLVVLAFASVWLTASRAQSTLARFTASETATTNELSTASTF